MDNLIKNSPNTFIELVKSNEKLNINTTNLIAQSFAYKFIELSNNVQKISDLPILFKFFSYCGVDPIEFYNKTNLKFNIELKNNTIENISFLIEYANKNLYKTKFKYSFELIESFTNIFSFELFNTWSDEDSLDIEKFTFLWKNQNKYIHYLLSKEQKVANSQNLSALQILEQYPHNKGKSKEKWYQISYYYYDEEDKKRILNIASYIELNMNLNSKEMKNKKAIKL